MKTKFALLILIASAAFTSCKDSKNENKSEELAIDDTQFKVTTNVIVKKDDDFSLFYTEDGSIDFKGDPIWISVKGSESVQQVVYKLPKDVFPTELRLDFGMKKDQDDIVLQSVDLEYKGKKRTIAGAELGNFFRPDESKCSFDPLTGIIKAVVKDGVRQFPSLYPQEANLKPEIEKLAK